MKTPWLAFALMGFLSMSPQGSWGEGISTSPELSGMSKKDRVVFLAKKMLHVPYRFGGSTPRAMDCSAFVRKVYRQVDISLPRTAREQFKIGKPVGKEKLLAGDLVFFRTYASFPSHVGIYLEGNQFIHASWKRRKVIIDRFDIPYYTERFIGARRVLPEE